MTQFPYRSPVDRAFLANLLKTLEKKGAKAIGVDVLFDQPTEPEKDALLKQAGTGKSRLLTTVIYLADMRHKAQMDEAWLEWVDPQNTPARACVETRLGNLGSAVMIHVVAAL